MRSARLLQDVSLWTLALAVAGALGCDPQPSGRPAEYDQFEAFGDSTITTFTTGGCRYAVPAIGDAQPIITWGVATGGSPTLYTGLLDQWATHRFITVATTSTQTGDGVAMRACLNDARALPTAHPSLAGAAGHSQGAVGALNAAEDDGTIDATAVVQPASSFVGNADPSSQTADMLCLTGSEDTTAPTAQTCDVIFQQSNVPTFQAERDGANHFEPTGSGTNDYTGITTAWFVYKLLPQSPAHADAASLFQGGSCGICGWSVWNVNQKLDP